MISILEVRNLSKQFDGNYVLKNISLSIKKGEIYGIIGANGSGKSTFMNILNGNEAICGTGGYEGEIFLDGKPVSIESHEESKGLGFAMVHQELALFKGMTVAQNIKINRENTKSASFIIPELALVDEKKDLEDAKKTLERIGVTISPESLIDPLSLNEKQFVELARELDNENIRLLMLDEPTSSLNINETNTLLKRIREIADFGISIIFVSHRLEEIAELCDRVSVFRDGVLVSSYERAQFDTCQFADDMVGQEIVKAAHIASHESEKTIPLLEYRSEANPKASLTVCKGEILGITGLAGQGQATYSEGLFYGLPGDLKAVYKGEPLSANPETLIKKGIYYLSEDRSHASLFLDNPIWKNMIFGTWDRHPEFLKHPKLKHLSFLNHGAILDYARQMADQLNIVSNGPDQIVRELSGGNQQKVCVARALTFQPELLFIGEPTRGIDIYSKELILDWLLKINEEYKATVVVTSGELEELIRVCDRIAVMYQGEVFKIFSGDIHIEELTYALYGREFHEK